MLTFFYKPGEDGPPSCCDSVRPSSADDDDDDIGNIVNLY